METINSKLQKHLVNLAKMSDYYDEIISLSPKDLSLHSKLNSKKS